MTDIRERLNARRDAIRKKLQQAETWVDEDADPTSLKYEKGARQISELLQIEAILAQMQTADAQRALAAAQREVASAQTEDTKAREQERSEREGEAFWLRRFVTSLALAHGAGTFGAITALLRPDPPEAKWWQVFGTLGCFLLGLVIAGTLPLWLAAKTRRRQEAQGRVWDCA